MLTEMARMSCDDGMVMQLHAGEVAVELAYGLAKSAYRL
jgi:glucuronate isomerase